MVLYSLDTMHLSVEYLFPIIKFCILDIESCGLKVHIISAGTYYLNVNLFNLFSPSRQLQTSVPHTSANKSKLFGIIDFVHILNVLETTG